MWKNKKRWIAHKTGVRGEGRVQGRGDGAGGGLTSFSNRFLKQSNRAALGSGAGCGILLQLEHGWAALRAKKRLDPTRSHSILRPSEEVYDGLDRDGLQTRFFFFFLFQAAPPVEDRVSIW